MSSSRSIPPPGTYEATAVRTQNDAGESALGHWGKSSQKGTKYVRIGCKLLDGAMPGYVVFYDGYFTEKTVERTLQALRYMGLKSGSIIDINKDPMDQRFQVVVEHESFTDEKTGQQKTWPRVAWVNRLGGAVVKISDPLGRDELQAFASRMTARLAKIGAVEGPKVDPAEAAAAAGIAAAGGASHDDEDPFGEPDPAEDDIPF